MFKQTFKYNTLIFLILFFSRTNVFSQWQLDEFIIATWTEDALSIGSYSQLDYQKMQLVKDAHFNLISGHHYIKYNTVQDFEHNRYYLEMASQFGLKYMTSDVAYRGIDRRPKNLNLFDSNVALSIVENYQSGLTIPQREAFFGYSLGDEPRFKVVNDEAEDGRSVDEEQSILRSWTRAFNQIDPFKATFVNLFPYYQSNINSIPNFDEYMDSYLLDPIQDENVNIYSFDHYPFETAGIRTSYFYNLQEIRNKANGRPFCSVVLTSRLPNGVHEDPDENKLRFMTFSPIAYGAKGVFYWKYQGTPKVGNYLGQCLGNFRSDVNIYGDKDAIPVPADYNNDGHIDLGLKTSDGRWLINYWENGDENGYNTGYDWDFVSDFNVYGDKDAIPVPADYNNDGHIDLGLKTSDGRWLINYWENGDENGYTTGYDWDFVSDFNVYGDIDAIPVPADYNNDGYIDLGLKTSDGRWLINYWENGDENGYTTGYDWDFVSDFNVYGDIDAIPVPADYNNDGYIDLGLKTSGGRWLINYWEAKDTVELGFDGYTTGFAWDFESDFNVYGDVNAIPVPDDYNGDGRIDLGIKSSTGTWYINHWENGDAFGYTTGDQWDFISDEGIYGDVNSIPVPADYNNDGNIDLGIKLADGTWAIDYKVKEGLVNVDADNNPTPTCKYSIVQNNNLYIKNILGPIVMNSDYIGTFHVQNTLMNQGFDFEVENLVNPNTPLIQSMNHSTDETYNHLFAGLFIQTNELNDIYYGLVTNKALTPIQSVNVVLKGDFRNVTFLSPRLNGYDTNPTMDYTLVNNISYDDQNDLTTVTIPELKGGEVRVIKLALRKGLIGGRKKNDSILKNTALDNEDINFYSLTNYPNPFSLTTEIHFSLSQDSYTKLTIYDINGQEIETVVDSYKDAGSYYFGINSRNMKNGIYICKLVTNLRTLTRKLVVNK
ncbi:T9SS type A sorting domain-containing protein [Fulvivirga sp. M361]|uniref:T9SS type A sorting domain-containing protein n=1 Tax=Fulvivirga sp. M361 TaxID=2594266 RepID=UPI00117AD22D|nr:T9SS type A sorting domain-containing protein [Fulvivirga sp. M361]TRX61857.1 T9SS type A sorting domain-containing protein [Fulvivirga sp. M361]